MSKILSDEDGDTIWNDPTPNIDDELDNLLDSTFAYGVDWTEYKDKSDTDHEVSTYAGKIKDEMKAKLKQAITNKIKEAELEAVYNVFYMVWIEDGAPLQRDDPPSEILRHIEKLESEATDV